MAHGKSVGVGKAGCNADASRFGRRLPVVPEEEASARIRFTMRYVIAVLALAGAIVAAELALAAALVSGSTRRLASGLAVLLFGSFTSVSVISARRRLVVPCACFGPSRSHLGWGTAARSIVLVAYALLIMFGAPAATPQSTLVYESFGAAALLLTPFIVGSAVDLWIGARDVLGESG